MSQRHTYAVAAAENNDIIQLARLYIGAIEECVSQQVDPYKDCACRMIAFQIAFAGGGDDRFHRYYQDSYNFCLRQVERDKENIPEDIKDVEPKVSPAS